jgi:hypothetical protein
MSSVPSHFQCPSFPNSFHNIFQQHKPGDLKFVSVITLVAAFSMATSGNSRLQYLLHCLSLTWQLLRIIATVAPYGYCNNRISICNLVPPHITSS